MNQSHTHVLTSGSCGVFEYTVYRNLFCPCNLLAQTNNQLVSISIVDILEGARHFSAT